MNLTLKTTALAGLILAHAAAGQAQDAAAPAVPTVDTATVGQFYTLETSDPWELRCTKTDTGNDPCQIFQRLRDEAGGDVAEFNMFKIPEGGPAAAGAIVVAPLETLLKPGLVIQVDDKEPRSYSFAYCNDYGCIARVGFTAEELGWMQAGNQAVLTIVPALAPETKVSLNLSLKGFSDMLEKTGEAK